MKGDEYLEKKRKKIYFEIGGTILAVLVFVSILVVGFYLTNKKTYPWYISKLNMETVVEKYTGADVTIAILDTGLSESMQEELQDRIYKPYNVLSGNTDILDTVGHGTKITSVISSRKYGIAKEAKIMPIVVCDSSGRTKGEYLEKGIQYAIKNNADIINISMGSFNRNEGVENAINAAVEKGILIVAAAGDYSESSILYPARYDGVISVAAQSKLERLYKNANFSSDVDACIPGEAISVVSLDGIDSMEGSSIATAVYTSILSLFLEKYKDEKNYNEIYTYIDSIQVDENQFMDIGKMFTFGS